MVRPRLRIIHAPAAVAGNAQQLARAMRLDGHIVSTLVYEATQFTEETDFVVWPCSGTIFWREWRRLLAVLQNVWQHDVYIFNYGSTLSFPATEYRISGFCSSFKSSIHALWVDLLQIFELLILFVRRARVVIVFQGDDARQGDVQIDKYSDSIAHHVPRDYYTRRGDCRKRRLIARLRRFGTRLVAVNPDLLNLLGADSVFIPYGHIDLQNWTPSALPPFDNGLVIGHFPSNPEVKGTRFIVEAIKNLRDERKEVTLKLLTGGSQEDVRGLMEQCHLVIDQLHAGFYGGVAVEAMSLGRPAAAFIRSSDLSALPTEFVRDLPIISVTASSVENQIRLLMRQNIEDWYIQCKLSRTFVETWHNPHVIARQLIELAKPLRLKRSTRSFWGERDIA